MKIKTIKLNGFKSFGEKTEIKFDDNLIGIVGPNGSGKSNIIDAIKWVFGEQKSKNLRTTMNTDIIFVGSETKKAMNFAEVTLVFDNSDHYLDIDYNEVAVARRLYRTGENEYFLNKTKCRLKDINELMMDKAIGKDSFSIISQGKVEEIIMAKPEKRREVIEEVAGILKYKYKKDSTERKLQKTDENIAKINFIIKEISNNLEPLKLASTKAMKYKELNEELTEKDIALNAIQAYDDNQKFENYKLQSLKFEAENNKLLNKINLLEKELFEYDNNISLHQKNLNILSEKLNENKSKILLLDNKISLIKERNSLYKSDNENEQRKNFLEEEIEKIKIEKHDIQIILSKLIPQKNEFFQKLNKLKENYQNLNIANLNNEKELGYLEEQLTKVNYPYAVEKILDRNIDGINGTINSLLTIQANYELAISVILGGRVNEIVTENEIVAKQAIEILKKEKYGRVTFIPLNKIRPRFIDEETKKILKQNSDLMLGTATDFIKYDLKYKKVFDSLLGTTLICKNIDLAYKVAKLINNRYQIVTLEGDIIANNGKITGGLSKQFNKYNTLDKRNDLIAKIQEFKTNKENLLLEIEELSIKYNEINIETNVNKKYLEEKEEKIYDLEQQFEKLKKITSGNDSSDDLSNKYLEERQTLINKEIKYLEEQEILKVELDKFIENKEVKNDELLNIRANQKIIAEKVNDKKIEIVQLENLINQRLNYLREVYKISFEKAYGNSGKNIDIQKYNDRVDFLKKEIKNLGFVNFEAIEQYELQQQKYDFYNNQKEDLEISKQKIVEVIETLDNFVKIQFKDAHEKLNIEFKKIFKELFGGGNAELILTSPDDILSTGVEIIAQPPGKKSQIIGLLSGGEKALTAIALLFSILRVRVVPFAILDEVEAALDEVNVSRYANYLKIFSQKTQFLVITHRQGTMEKVDKLYGVTMPQKGISKVLDIDLKEKNV